MISNIWLIQYLMILYCCVCGRDRLNVNFYKVRKSMENGGFETAISNKTGEPLISFCQIKEENTDNLFSTYII